MPAVLARLFPVRRQDLGRLIPCFIIYFLVIAGVIFGRNARDSLFLKEIGIKWLPCMYIANAFAVVLCSLVYTAFVDKIPRSVFVTISSTLFIGALFLSRFILQSHAKWFYVVLYMMVQVIWLLSVMQFWTFAGDLFDTRAAKRLFPVINMGGLLGMVGAGFGGKPLVNALADCMGAGVGTENLIAVWGLLLVFATLLFLWIGRRYGKPPAPQGPQIAGPKKKESQVENLKEGWGYLRGSSLMKTVALITLAQWIVFTLVDYLFNAETKIHFHNDKDAMTKFFGTFRGLAGLTALLIQVFATSRLISLFGVGKTILAQPAFLILSTGAMRMAYGFFTSCVAKFGDHVLLYTIQESSYQLLYNPVPLDRRGRMRAFVEGYIKPISMGIAGVVLVIAAWKLPKEQLATVSIVLSVAWFVLARRVGASYFNALVGNLTQGSDVRDMTARQLSQMRDEQTTTVLLRQLEVEDEEAVIFALEIIGRIRPHHARQAVEAKLRHPSETVREAALNTLGRMEAKKSVEALFPCLSDESSKVRAAAARALGMIGEEVDEERLTPLLLDPVEEVRVESMVALTKTASLDGILLVAERVREMLKSDSTEDRSTAAHILGRLKTRHFTPSLLPLARESDPRVRMAALRALGEAGDPRGLPVILAAMEDRSYRYRARKAALNTVDRHKKAGTKAVIEALKNETLPSAQARGLEILGHCSGEGVLPLCLQYLHDTSAEVRSAALEALSTRSGRGGAPQESTVSELTQYARLEIVELYEDLQVRALLEASFGPEKMGFLSEAIETDNIETRYRILNVIGLLTDRAVTRAISRKLHSANPRERSDAIEALDSLGLPDIARPLIATLDLADSAATLTVCRQVLGENVPDEVECLRVLLNHASVLLRAVTTFFLGQHKVKGGLPDLIVLLQDHSGLVRETALVSLAALEPENLNDLVEPLLADPSPRVRSVAQHLLQPDGHEGEKVMLSTIEKILFLKTVSFFSELNGEELRDLADLATEQDFPAETVLYKPNDAADSLYVIISGHCVVQRDINGETHEMASLGARDYFGEMSLLDGEPHTTTATLTEDSSLLSVTRDSFRDLIKEDPDIAFDVFKELSRRLRQQRDMEEFRHLDDGSAQPVHGLTG
ncbi:MAG: HEAT repeat domain-containing protein [Armatimonadetes bacterium]|nr:HEAT repeat domain-containing protein [Armatimonadota bacterium]